MFGSGRAYYRWRLHHSRASLAPYTYILRWADVATEECEDCRSAQKAPSSTSKPRSVSRRCPLFKGRIRESSPVSRSIESFVTTCSTTLRSSRTPPRPRLRSSTASSEAAELMRAKLGS